MILSVNRARTFHPTQRTQRESRHRFASTLAFWSLQSLRSLRSCLYTFLALPAWVASTKYAKAFMPLRPMHWMHLRQSFSFSTVTADLRRNLETRKWKPWSLYVL